MAYTTINKSTAHFDTKLYSGNGGTQTITGLGHQPDMTLVKSRDTTDGWTLQDAVRGFGSTTKLSTYDSSSENDSGGGSYGNYGYQSAATADGFTMVAGSTPGQNNKSGNNYIAWNWKANGTGSSNTDGSITSTVSANTTSGFSIVTWTGDGSKSATVGHGLGSELSCIIIKERTGGDWWHNWQKGLSSNSHNVFFNQINAERAAYSDGHVKKLDNTTTFGFDSSTTNVNAVNHSSIDNVGYCFAEKKGFSKFGTYQGNGNADGPFSFCGFKPTFIMIKRTDVAKNWYINDNLREGYNNDNPYLSPNITAAETGGTEIDILSNGFKLRASGTGHNESGGTYMYMAFGQSIVGSNNVPATAR